MEKNKIHNKEEEREHIEKEQILIDPNKEKYELISTFNFTKNNIFNAEMKNGDSTIDVVIKKIDGISKDEDEAKNALREVSILSFVKHRMIIKLLDIRIPEQKDLDYLYLVTEKKPYNLKQVIKNQSFDYLNDPKYKNYIPLIIHKILSVLKYLHSRKIMHRDIKPSNILTDNSKSLIYLCDFGLARSFKDIKENERFITKNIGTLSYVAPEMLGNEEYGMYNEKVDIWAVGCIMIELYTRKSPYFANDKNDKNKNEENNWNWLDQLKKIFSVFGRPEEKVLEKVFRNKLVYDEIKNNTKEKDYPKKNFDDIFPEIKDEKARNLLQKLFEFDYKKRISAENALKDPFFEDIDAKEKKRKEIEFGKYESKFNEYKEEEEKNKDNKSEEKSNIYENLKEAQIEFCQNEIEKCYKQFLKKMNV